eukprot:CAMPEP_0115408398 /NCGR_PEP_ID=MMETSP0271-20121206/19464_1 /TAXON_ID=71861 /ORGANISM="Scrippsiella trochoidea, Strain CCMP3099" /LENGTH=96 /DNA_ID=CAMNT_0002832505 /DNA_START=153 /DNA_END=442 /DNA_ORIENTATION=+
MFKTLSQGLKSQEAMMHDVPTAQRAKGVRHALLRSRSATREKDQARVLGGGQHLPSADTAAHVRPRNLHTHGESPHLLRVRRQFEKTDAQLRHNRG